MQQLISMWSASTYKSGTRLPVPWMKLLTVLALAAFLAACAVLPGQAQSVRWVPRGSSPTTKGQVENVQPNNEVVGAINALAPHPTNANVLYVGAVNGGIWKTENATATAPKWQSQTDSLESLAIGALAFDPLASSHQTLVAATGGNSSFGTGGQRIGILVTDNGGQSWKAIDGAGTLAGLNLSGVAPRGAVIVLSAVSGESLNDGGIWRSQDHGGSFKQISGTNGSGLPDGASYTLRGDPANPRILYSNAGGRGIYRSDDLGETWTRISDAVMNGKLSSAANVEIAVGNDKNLFVAIVGSGRQLSAVFCSLDQGGSWSEMDLPATTEGGIHPGRQGTIHLSLVADPTVPSIVYVGGDRQDGHFPVIPNSIGARDYTGRLFRGDASRPAGKQWVHLTHSSQHGPAGGGTVSNSAPHADSRDMAFAADGRLIEADDGGVYVRTLPQTNRGDWFSLNGNLQTSEYHAVAWDSVSDRVIAAAQDTGTSEQILSTQATFQTIVAADGSIAEVDDTSSPEFSIRYSSYQFLGRFRRRTFDSQNRLLGDFAVPLAVVDQGAPLRPQFYTPIALNNADRSRMIIGAKNSVYESLNQGDTVREIGPGIRANGSGLDTLAYGAADNPDILYVGESSFVHVRVSAHPKPLAASPSYRGGIVMGISNDPRHANTAAAIDPTQVYRTLDAGDSWVNVTSSLPALNPGLLTSVEIISGPPAIIVVGAQKGVFSRRLADEGNWIRLGEGLPKVPVYHLEYDDRDQVLLAGTLGRGAWTLASTTSIPQALAMLTATHHSPVPAAHAAGNGQPTQGGLSIADGVVYDPQHNRVFIMLPNGGIRAIDVETGQALWTTRQADRPLAVVAGRVVGQIDAPQTRKTLGLIVIDSQSGERLATGSQELPGSFSPAVNETLQGRFDIDARTAGADLMVRWEFKERPARALPPGVAEPLPARFASPAPLDSPERVGTTAGVFTMNLTSGKTHSLNLTVPASPPRAETRALQPNQWVPDLPGDQFLTKDGRHIAVSHRSANVKDWEKYTIAVYDRKTKQSKGRFRCFVAAPPLLVVQGTRVLWLSEPYQHRPSADAAMQSKPRQLHCVRLSNGSSLWAHEVRDTSYRGPFPP